MNDSPPASTIPLFGDIRLDEAGRLWVEDYYPWTPTAGDGPRWWTVFERVRDELDVERVVVHRIVR